MSSSDELLNYTVYVNEFTRQEADLVLARAPYNPGKRRDTPTKVGITFSSYKININQLPLALPSYRETARIPLDWRIGISLIKNVIWAKVFCKDSA